MSNNLFLDNVSWKAVKYIRLSIDDKDTEDISNSVINQGKIIDSFAKNDNSITIVDSFVDDGYTGTNFIRPAFKAMMQEIESGNINCIIVKSLSRLGRSQEELLNLTRKYFPSKDVRFISIKERIDSYNYKKRLNGYELPMLAFMAEMKPMETSQNTRMNLEINRNKGLFMGSMLPYGYLRSKHNKHYLVVDENVKDNVVLIFSMFIEGNSMKDIASCLNDMDVLSPMAYFVKIGVRKLAKNINKDTYIYWRNKHVKKILSCEIYTGDMVQGTTASFNYKSNKRIPLPREKWAIVKGTHEPIISHSTFETASEILSKNQKPTVTKNTKPSIFAGYLYCDDCKKAMVRNSYSLNGNQYLRFICSNYKKNSSSACSVHLVNENVIYDVVLFSLQYQIENLLEVESILNKISIKHQANNVVTHLMKQKKEVNEELVSNQSLIKESYKDYACGILNDKEYVNIKSILQSDNEQLKAKLEHVESEVEKTTNLKLEYNSYIKEFIQYKNTKKLTRSIIVSLIDGIYIGEEKNIRVVFKYESKLKEIRSIFAK